MKLQKLKSLIMLAVLGLTLSMAVSACGVKPKKVKAPETSENTPFPRPYPSE